MSDCKDWSFIEYVKNSKPACEGFELPVSDSEVISDYVTEHLNIAAAKINVFKLLGVHEQGQLQDLTGNGVAISGGDGNAHPAFSAFNKLCGEWRSKQRGPDVVKSAFIGYDFGPLRDENTNKTYYAVETYDHVHVATIRIQQGANPAHRASKIRVERSLDGMKWYGVQILTMPDNDELQTIHFKGSAPSRYWRLRPTEFKGGSNDWWAVQRIEMHDYEQTSLTNIQGNGVFEEVRDRDYSENSLQLKMYYDLVDRGSNNSQFGFTVDNGEMTFQVSFKESVAILGRPIVVGDIFEIPSEMQYNTNLVGVAKYVEVTDVAWSAEGYTPAWVPTIQKITAAPMLASQETKDIVNYIKKQQDGTGFIDVESTQVIDYKDVTARLQAASDANVPERGADTHKFHTFTQEEIDEAAERGVDVEKLNVKSRALYIEDGMPPNNAPYTEGPNWPVNPRDGDYHRLTYEGYDTRIPVRLHKYSGAKNRWLYYETDRRQQYNVLKPSIQELIESQYRAPTAKVLK